MGRHYFMISVLVLTPTDDLRKVGGQVGAFRIMGSPGFIPNLEPGLNMYFNLS